MITQDSEHRTETRRRRQSRLTKGVAATAVVVVIGAFSLFGNEPRDAVAGGISPTPTHQASAPTTEPPTTQPPTTQTPTTQAPVAPPTPADQATMALDDLLAAFDAEDAEAVQVYSGETAVFKTSSGQDLAGADAAAYWERAFGERGERLTDAFKTDEEAFVFVVRYLLPGVGARSWNTSSR